MPVIINFKICDNCGACNGIRVCPTGAFHFNEEKKTLEVDEDKCIGCGLCGTSEESCSVQAIKFAKDEEELLKIKKEIDADPRTIEDLMVDRYGAQPIYEPFHCKEDLIEKVLTTPRTILVEVFKEDTEECLIKSIPVKEIFKNSIDQDLTYRKLEIETDNFTSKYDVKELPSLLVFRNGNCIGKIDGYYPEEKKQEFFDRLNKILDQNA